MNQTNRCAVNSLLSPDSLSSVHPMLPQSIVVTISHVRKHHRDQMRPGRNCVRRLQTISLLAPISHTTEDVLAVELYLRAAKIEEYGCQKLVTLQKSSIFFCPNGVKILENFSRKKLTLNYVPNMF